MMDEFRRRRVKKSYVAFVHGRLKRARDTIKSLLYNRNKRRREPAITRYRVIAAARDFSVLEVEPVTGRTNQIRRHLCDIGHPLVGERVFAFAKDFELKFRRAALHAAALEFVHPVTNERVRLSARIPPDMADFLKARGISLKG
jgi:23S rRNA-/tRNA-specific pseudouridylate synthase